MRFHETYAVLLAVALTSTSATSASGMANWSGDRDSTVGSEVVVRVVNNNWLDINVYAVAAGGARDRLGTVRSFTTEEFEVSSRVTVSSHDLTLVVLPIGSRERHSTGPILFTPGDIVEWQVENNLSLSRVAVYSSASSP